MAAVLVKFVFYTIFGFIPLGSAIYLFASAKGRAERYVFGTILLLIGILGLLAQVDTYPR
jgi:hypothetical protein